MSASDVESLQPRASSRRRYLHAFLITSVITLFVLLSGVAVTAALFIRQIQTELATLTKPTHPSHMPYLGLRMENSGYKVQNCAFLRASSGRLENVTVEWMAASSESVGSGYEFNDVQHTLQPHKEGSYLIYLDLVLRCTDRQHCGSADVTVRVSDGGQGKSVLECRASSRHQGGAAKCWKVVRLGSQHRLVALMEAHGTTKSWELDKEQSGMGMFLVD